ncbi:leucine-rich repeat-containing protein 37A2-like isoform X1 [Camelus ferus]|uniref:Leucine-rich repeat-containing protein 37A2-like isoform X1 n=1 Tax=Camelus ferus TaxID=419612 RepID=A0A8B8UJG1_CAMFR|nr:leucine-rich repeat-containing protein 37A2-like isoform X1 [Camelus ferus]
MFPQYFWLLQLFAWQPLWLLVQGWPLRWSLGSVQQTPNSQSGESLILSHRSQLRLYFCTRMWSQMESCLQVDVAVPRQGENDRITQHQKLPEEVPVLGWDQNQAPALSRPKVLQEAPYQPPESPEEVEPSPVQEEAASQPPESPEEVQPSLEQEAQAQPAEHPEEAEPPPFPQEAQAQPAERPEYDSAPLQQEAPAQVPGSPGENVPQFPASEEAAARPGSNYPAHSKLSSVTLKPVDLELMVTPEPAKEGEFTAAQQEPRPQPPEYSVEAEPSPTPQDATGQPPEPPEEAEPSPGEQGRPAQPYEPNGEVVPFSTQQESPAQPTEHPEVVNPATQQESPAQSPAEIEPSATQQESTAQRPQSPAEAEPSPAHSQDHVTTASPPGQDQAQSLQWPSVTVKPVDLALTITSGPTSEAGPSPPQQEASSQSAGSPEQLEPLLVEQEVPEQPPAPSGNGEPSPVQLEPPTQPPETSTAATAQHPVHNEVTFSPAGPGEAQHPVMPSTIGKPLDLTVVITPEPAKEAESSPEQQEGSAHFPVSPEQAEISPVQSKPLSPSPEHPGKVESSQDNKRPQLRLQVPLRGWGFLQSRRKPRLNLQSHLRRLR